MRCIVFVLLGLMPWIVSALPASAADPYPQRNVTLLVPFPAGGSFDVIGRLIARSLAEKWGYQVVVENKPGAAGDIGWGNAAKAAPDGYTLVLASDGILSNEALTKKRAFDPLKSFTPITLVARSPQILVGGPALKAKTLAEVVAQGRDTAIDLRFGTAGAGTPGHLVVELLNKVGNTKIRHVPYRGGAPALTDLLGGQIQLVSTGLPAMLPSIQAGSIVPIAVSSEKRFPSLPNVPSMNEAVPGVAVDTWYGVIGPAGLPNEIRDKIHADIVAVMSTPSITTRLTDTGFEFVGSGPAEFSAIMQRDLPRWREIVEMSGIKPE
jgi:tripartite-type tricarboxylate transporter receptor subunit TctC